MHNYISTYNAKLAARAPNEGRWHYTTLNGFSQIDADIEHVQLRCMQHL